MARYGFLLDQDSCIGCHACTVACKAEHRVPLGVNRTWVKYIEKGAFPDTRRHFAVLRCNHCDDAPCITICPTGALFRRDNGIVDFDTASCIGCKSCQNACPYDAIYIDPEDNTAQKCNFCAHRVEVGLEPSCVIVCPTRSIVAGDLDDPLSAIARMVSRHDVAVRLPEQGTRPKVYYKGADAAALDPLQTSIAPDGMIWADTGPDHPTPPRLAPSAARTVYTTAHPMAWKGRVSGYLVTKSIAAGALMLGALLVILGHADDAVTGILVPLVSAIFVLATAVLLVTDLKKPSRFMFILTRPNWSSWLTRGSVALAIHALVAALWLMAGLLDRRGLVQAVAVPGLVAAAASAGYTAYLFGQCQGRNLWQTPLLLPILLAQAVVAGAAALLIADVFAAVPSAQALRWALLGGTAAVGGFTAAELTSKGTAHVEMAVFAMTKGSYAARFWLGGILLGLAVPALLVTVALVVESGEVALGAMAGLASVAGLFAYEDAFVRAGQSVPLS